ncbi:MAG: carbohydrate ABC transporter permease [Clostridiaceae bacterium]|nr:carbohydrate ABC transporter permease [Clostridiaceae bacterium]
MRTDSERARRAKKRKKAIHYLVCSVIAVIMLFPFYWMFTTSLKTYGNVMKFPPQWWPDPITLDNFIQLFSRHNFLRYLWNSFYIAALVSIGVVIVSSLAGYAFAKMRFKGSNVLFLIILSGMMMPIEVTIIPLFIALSDLNLANSHFGLIIQPIFGYCGAFGTFLMRQFFITVPTELIEAGKIDGASHLRIFRKIVLPLASSTIATLVIFTFLQSWNDYLMPLVLLNDSRTYTLPLGLKLFASEMGVEWNLVMAGATFSTLPMLIVFFFAQRKFMESLAMAGLKG